ncbi:hypothetical protein [Amycolatopsis acidiphila]|nr:hypothetical protein [Amycolatopsis acidiphila]
MSTFEELPAEGRDFSWFDGRVTEECPVCAPCARRFLIEARA